MVESVAEMVAELVAPVGWLVAAKLVDEVSTSGRYDRGDGERGGELGEGPLAITTALSVGRDVRESSGAAMYTRGSTFGRTIKYARRVRPLLSHTVVLALGFDTLTSNSPVNKIKNGISSS